MITPLPHQQYIIDNAKNRLALFLGTGAGKTYTSLWCLEKLKRGRTLVIVPLIVFYKWQKDAEALHGEGIFHEYVPGRWGSIVFFDKDIHIDFMTKEYFRDKYALPLQGSAYDSVIIDEAHYFSSPSSGLTKKLFKFIQLHRLNDFSVYLLTATPYLSTPWNIYTLGRHLGFLWEYSKFRAEMFFSMNMGGKTVWKPKSNAPELVRRYKDAMGYTIRTEDVIEDLPPQIVLDQQIEITEEQKKAIANDTTVDVLPRITKLHQIENGYIPENELAGTPALELEYRKPEYCIQYYHEHKHVAYICRYTYQIEMLAKAFEKEGILTFTLTGQTKDREKIIDKARKTQCAIIIQSAVSEGYELPEIEHVVFVSMDWSYKNYIQMMGRFLRINHPTKTTFTRLLCGKYDKLILQAINRKEDFYVEKE